MKRAVLYTCAVVAVLMILSTVAMADLTITPVRVVFEGRDRSAVVELINETDHVNTYRMTWVHMKAKPEGGYEMDNLKQEDKNPFSVDSMVVFTPRQVTIEPHGHQIVRLSLRRPENLPAGEYRAHMAMTRMANEEKHPQDPAAEGVELSMNVNLGFSIPVIVRSGDDKDLKISLNAPKLQIGPNKKPELYIQVNRDAGKFSSYGTLKVSWQPPKGAEKEIGVLSNVALFPELPQRQVIIPLRDNPTSGSLKVVYLGKYESDGKTWAETTFPIGK